MKRGPPFFQSFKRAFIFEPRLGVVVGFDAKTVGRLHRYPSVELAVVGGAITRVGDPRGAAAAIRAALDERT